VFSLCEKTMANRKSTSSEKMSRSIESQVEAGLRSFLAKSGVPAIASVGSSTFNVNSNNALDAPPSAGAGISAGAVGLGFGAGNNPYQKRTTSADSSLLPPINKDKEMNTMFVDQTELLLPRDDLNANLGGSNSVLSLDDDEEVATQASNRRILETLTSELIQQQLKQPGPNGGNNNRKTSQKLVSGTQFRIPQKEPVACAQCEHFDRSNRKLKEANRMLRLQVARLEEKIHDLRRAKSESAGGEVPDSNRDTNDNEHKTLLFKLESELAHWKKKYQELDQDKVVVDCSLVNARKELLERLDEVNRLKQQLAELKAAKEAMEKEFKQQKDKLMQDLDQNNRYVYCIC
jgi:hypothetical protein